MIYRDLIINAAVDHGIDARLFEAQIITESGGYTWAFNPEPRYRWLWNVKKQAPFRPLTDGELASKVPPSDFPCLYGDKDQEWQLQQGSIGLAQIMGAVARERGFMAPSLLELCDPATNLDIAAGLLRDLKTWAVSNDRKMLAAYNGGKGGVNGTAAQSYAEKVIALSLTL